MLTDWPKEAFPIPTLEAPEDPAGPFTYSPFTRCLDIRLQNAGTWGMPFSPKIIGSPILPAIHGGMTGAFLETSAITSVTRELSAAERPKPIGLTINYLRPGRAVDSYANVSIVKQGRRIVAFEARAWQAFESVFVHYSQITKTGLTQLPEGQRVSFEIGPGREGGTMAVNVELA
jgi:acyl-coenzyme A thioesterase PaaI-like protein